MSAPAPTGARRIDMRLSQVVALGFAQWALSHASVGHAQVRTEEECHRLHPDIASPVEYATCTFDLEGSQQALAESYTMLLRRLDGEARRAFYQTKRAWRKYRDNQCAFEAVGHTGTAGSSLEIACIADWNRERTKFLTEQLQSWP